MKQRIDRMKQENKRWLYRAVAWGCCLIVALSWGCTEADLRDEPGIPTGERLQVEIPVAEVPLQKVEPIDTKAMIPPAVTPTTPEGVTPCSSEGVTPTSPEGVTPCSSEGVTPVSPPEPATRAATYKRAIVLQYSTDGNTLLNAGSTNIDNYTIGNSISAKLVAATNCKIYVCVVNETTTTGVSFTTEAILKAATYDLYGKFPNATAGDVPLIGSLSGIDVVRLASGSGDLGVIKNSSDTNSKVLLSRIAAELSIKFTYNVPDFSITPAKATLQNVPKTFHLIEQSSSGVYPAEATASDFGPVEFTLTADGDKTSTTQLRYMPMNRRGSNSTIAYPKDKWSGTTPNSSARCTYLTFTATHKQNTTHRLAYSFYFGGDNTTNFDVLRNHIYTMNSTILQRSEGDKRIVEAGLSPLVATEPTVESIGTDRATIKGKVTDKRGAAITAYGFYYKKGIFADPANPASGGTKVDGGTNDIAAGTPFSYLLTGLTTNTAYSFAAYATSANGTSYGEPVVFGTNAPGLPSLGTQTLLASAADGKSVSSTGNTTTGTVLSNGVVWSTASNFDHLTSGTRASGSTTGSPYAVTVSGLTRGTTYYYRYFASNASGFVYGNAPQSVRTFDILTVPTAAAVTSTVVDQLHFAATTAKTDNADPNPTATGVKLWKTNPASLDVKEDVLLSYNAVATVGAKTVDWTGMTAGQQYWYASYATNSVGTGYSTKQTFTATAALSPDKPSVETLGPQAKTGITLATTGRSTTGVASLGATITSANSGTSKTISIADYTTATNSRTPTIVLTTVGELPLRTATVKITQYGVVFPASFSNVSNVVKAGQTATNVSVTANIPWKATSNQTWCTIGSGTQTGANTKDGSALNFTYTVAKNIGAARTATITVAGTGSWTSFSKTFTVAQLPGGQVDVKPSDPNTDNSNVDFKK